MLLEGALEKISTARGHMIRGEIEEKGRQTSWAISIIEGLRASLDHDAGSELAQNLDALYDYIIRRMWQANLTNQPEIFDEVAKLLSEIKEAWDAIPESVRQAHSDLMGEKQVAAQQKVENL